MACGCRRESLAKRERSIQRGGGFCRRTASQIIRLSHALHVKCKVCCTTVILLNESRNVCHYQLDHSGYAAGGLNRVLQSGVLAGCRRWQAFARGLDVN